MSLPSSEKSDSEQPQELMVRNIGPQGWLESLVSNPKDWEKLASPAGIHLWRNGQSILSATIRPGMAYITAENQTVTANMQGRRINIIAARPVPQNYPHNEWWTIKSGNYDFTNAGSDYSLSFLANSLAGLFKKDGGKWVPMSTLEWNENNEALNLTQPDWKAELTKLLEMSKE